MAFPSRYPNVRRTMLLTARAIACSMILLAMPACGIPPRRSPKPGPDIPESFNGVTSAENSAQLGVEDFYRDPKLLSLIEQSLANNRELKVLNEQVQSGRGTFGPHPPSTVFRPPRSR